MGFTDSADFPTTPDAYDQSYNGNWDLFVTKLTNFDLRQPSVHITVNGDDGPLVLGPGSPLTLAISFDAGSCAATIRSAA